MATKHNSDALRKRLRELSDAREIQLTTVSTDLGYNRSYLDNFIRKNSPRMLSYEDRLRLLELTPLTPQELGVEPPAIQKRIVAGVNDPGVAYLPGARAGAAYEPLTDTVYVIGSVQSGAWMEAYQLPEQEWTEMLLPADKRFPGIPRWALSNKGLSMNRVCPDGGHWIFVRYADLTGQGPSPGQYVIVERVRKDGLVEATAKRFGIGPGGKPYLYPESDDPTFQPFPLTGEGDVEEIRIIGRVTKIINDV